MKPKKTFTYFLNAGIICDTFEKHFLEYKVKTKDIKEQLLKRLL